MGQLTSQMQAELEFWKGLVQAQGPYYYAYRVSEYYEKTRYFPSWPEQKGTGIDVGCGCISVFEGSGRDVVACDVLADAYYDLLPSSLVNDLHVCMLGMRTPEDLPGLPFSGNKEHIGQVDWVACLNMIDHTPDSRTLLREIRESLKPGGRLYFEVNLEAGIAPPHHSVWTEQTVQEHMYALFRETHRFVQDVPEHRQRRYWAEFEVIK